VLAYWFLRALAATGEGKIEAVRAIVPLVIIAILAMA